MQKVKERPTVLCDIDNTLVNFMKRYCQIHKAQTKIDIKWDKIETYNMSKVFKTARKYEYLYRENFYKHIEFMPDAKETVNLLHEDYRVVFFTTCVTYESMIGKFNFVREHFPWFDIENNWMVMADKHLLNAEEAILIDDNPHHIRVCDSKHNICFAWLHNEELGKHEYEFRSNSWKKIYTYITKYEPAG